MAPYHTVVPSFGTWGFALAGERRPDPSRIRLSVPAQYLSRAMLPGLFVFPNDMAEVPTPVSHLNDAAVSRLYRLGYHKYLE